MAGISNVATEIFFENENEDIKKNFIGVHSSNSITRYISYYKIIREKCVATHSVFSPTTEPINLEDIGGAF